MSSCGRSILEICQSLLYFPGFVFSFYLLILHSINGETDQIARENLTEQNGWKRP